MNINVGKILARTAGVTGLALIGYDSHNAGKLQAQATQGSIKADSLADSYVNTMGQDTPSTLTTRYKKWLFNINTDETMTDFFTGIAGYFKGVFNMAAQNVIPLALACGTFFKSGIIAKGSAIGLLGYGLLYAIQNAGLTDSKKL